MAGNDLRLILRVLSKSKIFTVINLLSLALGMSFAVMIMGYVLHEFSFEDVHQNRDRIVRVEGSVEDEHELAKWAKVPGILGSAATEALPEVETAATFRYQYETDVEIYEREFDAGPTIYATPEYLQVFTFPLLHGNAQTALADPYQVLITEDAADEYFGGINPIGQPITLNDTLECKITGVLKSIPTNTQLKCDFIVSYSTLYAGATEESGWTNFGEDFVFLLLHDNVAFEDLETKLNDLFASNIPETENSVYAVWVKPLEDIYFSAYYDGTAGDIYPAGEWDVLYFLVGFAFFILLQAVLNYVNLATARSGNRTKEVSIRKMFGAFRSQLLFQFLGESVVLVFVALIISMGCYELFSPAFHKFAEYRAGTLELFGGTTMMVALFAFWIVVAAAAGLYPALYFTRSKPLALLASHSRIRTSKSWFRRIMVVFQFAIALIFITSSVIMYRQFTFLRHLDRNFRTDNMLVLNLDNEEDVDAAGKMEILRQELQQRDPSLVMTRSSSPPGVESEIMYALYPNEERIRDDMFLFTGFTADMNFLRTLDIALVEGKMLDEIDPDARNNSILIPVSTVDALEIENPIGHTIFGSGDKVYEVVGVVESFSSSFQSWRNSDYTFIKTPTSYSSWLTIQLDGETVQETIAMVGDEWDRLFPGIPYKYEFLDDLALEELRSDEGTMYLMMLLSGVTILIACLGVYGLVSFAAEQRTREIGIRKVLGASVENVISLLAREFVFLILIANVIALPLSRLMMHSYLQGFDYQIQVGFETFLFAGLLAAVLTVIAAGWQAWKAAKVKPVISMRHL
jgi:putative ABC transport system permease protein